MNELSSQAAKAFDYDASVNFVQCKKTGQGFVISRTAGKPDEVNKFNLQMEQAGALRKPDGWWFPGSDLAEAIANAKQNWIDQQIEEREGHGHPIEAGWMHSRDLGRRICYKSR